MKERKPNKIGCFPALPDGAHRIALGNGHAFNVNLERRVEADRMVIWLGVEGIGYWGFGRNEYVSKGYVREKMKPLSGGDAGNLADFLNDQVLTVEDTADRQGQYDEVSCEDWNLSEMVSVNRAKGNIEDVVDLGDGGQEITSVRYTIDITGPEQSNDLGKEACIQLSAAAEWLIDALFFDKLGARPKLLGTFGSSDSPKADIKNQITAAQHQKRQRDTNENAS
jgi:hypothetical protein